MDEPAALNKPVILIADDEPVPLAAMANALVRRYGEDYRIVAHSSPRAALDDLERLKGEGKQVVLLIADQWMPEMTGAEFLEKAQEFHDETLPQESAKLAHFCAAQG